MIRRVTEKDIFKTKLFTIKDIGLETDSGKKVTYQILEKGESSLIVPLTNEHRVLFVKEYFPAINQYQLGLPKGRVESGLDPKATANKELQEEIGYKAGTLIPLGIVTISPGYISQKTHIYLAMDLISSKLPGDELEALELVPYPLGEFEHLIITSQLTEARMITALFLTKKYLGDHKL